MEGEGVPTANQANFSRTSKGSLQPNLSAWPDEKEHSQVNTHLCGAVSFRTVRRIVKLA